jgi:hypothetical protein
MLLVMGFYLVLPLTLYGQLNTGTILGTVRDTSGSVVPSARVVVKNVGTGYIREIATDAQGDYSVTALDPGSYMVTVHAQGFEEFVHTGFELLVDQLLRVDVALNVGPVTQKIEVTGQPPVVQTDTSSIGQVIGRDQVQSMPLNGRYFLQLALLSPGSNPGAPGNAQSNRDIGSVSLSVNGMQTSGNNYMMDGLDNNLSINDYISVMPSIDTIQEFKVETNMYSAEFGHGAGAQINLVTKSGTNQLHGSAYEFLRNSYLDGTNFFTNRTHQTKPQYRQNQFGATLGGPVSIPSVYDGKDRTFFFFGYEGLRVEQGVTRISSVPSAAMQAGNFTASGLPTIYDPFNVVGGQRQPFLGNVIPAARINSASKFLESYVPLPNLPGTALNFALNRLYRNTMNEEVARVDHKLSDHDQMFVRVNVYKQTIHNPDNFGTPATGSGGLDSGSTQAHHPIQVVLAETHIFRPTLLNDFRLGYSHHFWDFRGLNEGHDYTSQAGITGLSTDPTVVGFPYIPITGFDPWGDGLSLPNPNHEESYFLSEHLNWVKGSHNIRAGGDLERYHFNICAPTYGRGDYSFTGVFTGANSGVGGTPYADFLLGYPQSAYDTVGPHGLRWNYMRDWFYGIFIQDDYRASKRLTLNLGLRYDQKLPPTEKFGELSGFDFATGQMTFCNPSWVPAGFIYGSERSFNCNNQRDDSNNFGPRFGFAYRLTGDNRTVLRGGYGVFYEMEGFDPFEIGSGNPPKKFTNTFNNDPVNPTTDITHVFAGTPVLGSLPEVGFIQKNMAIGYIQEWNFAFQRELLRGLSIESAYVGSKGTHMMWSTENNQPTPGPGAIQPRRPYPLFGPLDGIGSGQGTNFHSLQLKAEKRMGQGFTFLTAYTYSKSMDGWRSTCFNLQNRRDCYGPSDFDQTQRFVQSWLYAFPVGRGKKFLGSSRGLADAVIGGWNIGGIYTFGTGWPFTPTIGVDQANDGQGGQRPNLIGDPHLPNPTIDLWFNPAAYALPAQYTYGNGARNSLRGPHSSNLDFSARKVFNITERQHLEFRAEFFNILNHPNFGQPAATVTTTSTVGKISSALAPRDIQFALRYYF